MICPLCLSRDSEKFDQDKARSYFKCADCDLVFVPRDSLITSSAEKERYEAHENEASDDYINYLNKTVEALTPHLPKNSRGLDFGCGRTKLTENLFRQKGMEINSYDLFFHPDEKVLTETYDFILLSEVIEHLREPREIMLDLKKILKSAGRFFIKTKPRPDSAADFSKWFYKRDSTHVQFFNQKSFQELSRLLDMQIAEKIGDDLFMITQ